jgi:hypothetical protein
VQQFRKKVETDRGRQRETEGHTQRSCWWEPSRWGQPPGGAWVLASAPRYRPGGSSAWSWWRGQRSTFGRQRRTSIPNQEAKRPV